MATDWEDLHMHYKDLPTSVVVGNAADIFLLATWLEVAKAAQATHYYGQEAIEETPISGSVLYTSATFVALEHCFGQPLTSTQMAEKLMGSIRTLQYPLPAEHRTKWKKGFEIRKRVDPKGLTVFAFAAWVEP